LLPGLWADDYSFNYGITKNLYLAELFWGFRRRKVDVGIESVGTELVNKI
jgi:hypothetical protein